MIIVYAYDTFRDGTTRWRKIKSFKVNEAVYLGRTTRSATSDAYDLAEEIKKSGKYMGVKITHAKHIMMKELW